ncbi:MAG: hypothetical protein C0501_25750 [Isosphaera sp.]|nr:hypothetical protein [Isosphaera sp.]
MQKPGQLCHMVVDFLSVSADLPDQAVFVSNEGRLEKVGRGVNDFRREVDDVERLGDTGIDRPQAFDEG